MSSVSVEIIVLPLRVDKEREEPKLESNLSVGCVEDGKTSVTKDVIIGNGNSDVSIVNLIVELDDVK